MLVANIVPVNHLSDVRHRPYHMCLTALIEQSLSYANFYKQESLNGSFILLDNGAAEGEVANIGRVINAASIIYADEIVLPDCIYNKDKTLERSYKGLNIVKRRNLQLTTMGVPHGETFEEWCQCAEQLVDFGVDSIGVSKFVTPKYPGGRFSCVEYLYKILQVDVDMIDVHLLGCWGSPREIGMLVNEYPTIRGTDSAIAYVYSNVGVYLDQQDRPKGEVDFLNGQADPDCLRTNLHLWEDMCYGYL